MANEPSVRGRLDITIETGPPPDLAIEIEATRAGIDKLSVYAGLGVPEVWTFDGDTLESLVRRDDSTYARALRSAAFPFIAPTDLQPFLAKQPDVSETAWIRNFRQWVRETLSRRST